MLALPAELANITPVTKRQRRANLIAILIGLASTTVVLAAYVRGALDRLELITLDLRFRHTSSIRPSDQIVCLDITDRDLELLGRWPWPRDLQSPLVAIPAEFGAQAILVDLTWTEPETARSLPPEHADIVTKLDELAAGEPPEYVFPDLILRRTIALAGNVYVAYHHSVVDLERSGAFRELVELLLNDKTLAATQLASENGSLTGHTMGGFIYGQNKAALLHRWISWWNVDAGSSFSYSDHHSDIPMLEMVGHPVAVNPTRKMRRHATEHGWRVESF